MSKLFKVISVLALIISIFGLFYPVQKSKIDLSSLEKAMFPKEDHAS